VSALRCVEVVLTIPDNEALTALATLQRLGIAVAALERADVYCCEVDAAAADGLVETLRTLEPVFNPNKHALRVRDTDLPEAGELWVQERTPAPRFPTAESTVRIAGRSLPGVHRLTRAVSWRLLTAGGRPAERETVEGAMDLLCNPAFQKATTL